MEVDYKKVINYITERGKRLVDKSLEITDQEQRKIFFLEEDVLIERGLKEIIKSFGDDHVLYSEEENNIFEESKNLWIADPISGTQSFLNGLPHYCLVVAHVVGEITQFACVYDPSVDELFTAYLNKGAFLNGEKISVSNTNKKITLRGIAHFSNQILIDQLLTETPKSFDLEKSFYSYAFNYCSVASGRLDGLVSLTKDSFPEFAGSLIVREAGGYFTNQNGEIVLSEKDRVFVVGNKTTYERLFFLVNLYEPHI